MINFVLKLLSITSKPENQKILKVLSLWTTFIPLFTKLLFSFCRQIEHFVGLVLKVLIMKHDWPDLFSSLALPLLQQQKE